MVPPAPTTFSTINCCLSDWPITCARLRPSVSVGPPAVAGHRVRSAARAGRHLVLLDDPERRGIDVRELAVAVKRDPERPVWSGGDAARPGARAHVKLRGLPGLRIDDPHPVGVHAA